MTRKKIGLYLVFDNASNSGIVNYLFSFVKALNTLPDERKPALIIFHSENAPIDMFKAENYPHIRFWLFKNPYPQDLPSRIINKLTRLTIGRNVLLNNPIHSEDADFIFPYPRSSHFDEIKNKIYWLVDFSPYYIPDHLTGEQRKYYFEHVEYIVHTKNKVVLSSYDILNDLKKFHPDYSCQPEILRFAAVIPAFEHVDIDAVKGKFNIDRPYVMTPNQFWVHKNHMVMLKAAVILKQRGIRFMMVFTGSTRVESESNYYPSLLEFVKQNGLEEQIRFLGIVDRAEQLSLMKHAEALVQPSLFEGWSTLVEESKSLQKHIVVSDLAIHREQIDFNCTFFDPKDERQLASVLEKIFEQGAPVTPHDYKKDINAYAERILEIFS